MEKPSQWGREDGLKKNGLFFLILKSSIQVRLQMRCKLKRHRFFFFKRGRTTLKKEMLPSGTFLCYHPALSAEMGRVSPPFTSILLKVEIVLRGERCCIPFL